LLGSHSFPLCQSVGDAVIGYLKEVRPKSSHRELFLTMRAPYRPITSGTLWPVVARKLRQGSADSQLARQTQCPAWVLSIWNQPRVHRGFSATVGYPETATGVPAIHLLAR
jgi:hypothetical protein